MRARWCDRELRVRWRREEDWSHCSNPRSSTVAQAVRTCHAHERTAGLESGGDYLLKYFTDGKQIKQILEANPQGAAPDADRMVTARPVQFAVRDWILLHDLVHRAAQDHVAALDDTQAQEPGRRHAAPRRRGSRVLRAASSPSRSPSTAAAAGGRRAAVAWPRRRPQWPGPVRGRAAGGGRRLGQQSRSGFSLETTRPSQPPSPPLATPRARRPSASRRRSLSRSSSSSSRRRGLSFRAHLLRHPTARLPQAAVLHVALRRLV